MKNFKDLLVWQKSHALVLTVYKITQEFPSDEKYGLVSQMRRAGVSICANIAEGGKKSTKDYLRFLEISRGSLEEVRYYFFLSRDLGYIREEEFKSLDSKGDEIGRMLYGFSQSMRP